MQGEHGRRERRQQEGGIASVCVEDIPGSVIRTVACVEEGGKRARLMLERRAFAPIASRKRLGASIGIAVLVANATAKNTSSAIVAGGPLKSALSVLAAQEHVFTVPGVGRRSFSECESSASQGESRRCACDAEPNAEDPT
jgi:hypothetical protein